MLFLLLALLGAPHGNPPPPHSAPARQAPAPQHYQAPAPQHYQAPAPRAPQPSQHFNLSNDLNARPQYHAPVTNQYHAPVTTNTHGTYQRPITTRSGSSVVVQAPAGRAPQFHFNPGRIYPGPIVKNAHWNPNPWRWNRGIVWFPAPAYWGGGFWGPFAFGIPIVIYGNYAYDGDDYQSYQVAPDSPGAQLLQQYNLTQTQCGPPNLVVIWGPDDSVICAYPNDLVAPGQYTIDPSTLSLVLATGD